MSQGLSGIFLAARDPEFRCDVEKPTDPHRNIQEKARQLTSSALHLQLEETVEQAARHRHVIEGIGKALLRQVWHHKIPHLGYRFQDNPVELTVEGEHLAVKGLPWVILCHLFIELFFFVLRQRLCKFSKGHAML